MNSALNHQTTVRMTQLQAQRVVSATLRYGVPDVLLKPGTKVTLIWLRSYLEQLPIRLPVVGTLMLPPLKHEYEAYAHNNLGHFVRFNVTSDLIEAVQISAIE